MSWDQRLFHPITLPGRKPLFTLRDAAQYIIKLPKAARTLCFGPRNAGCGWRDGLPCAEGVMDKSTEEETCARSRRS